MKSLILSRPHLIVMIGIPGSGKSFFAEHFANTFKAPIISYDKIKIALNGHLINNGKEEIAINNTLSYMLDEVLKTGQTVLCDGQTYTRANYDLIYKKAHDLNYEPLFVWVQTDLDTSKKRALKKNEEKLALNSEQFDTLVKKFTHPDKTKKVIVISGKHTYTSQLKIVLKYLAQPV